jgi:NitT/TauT family transport system substrate-binding protein
MRNLLRLGVIGIAMAAISATAVQAQDRVRAIDSTRFPFEHFALHQAQAEGFFKKANLNVSVIFGDGGAATLQTLITGSQDIAVGVGALSVVAAYSRGAPVVILGSAKRGASELYWYVPADSPIKSFDDLDGKELVYSRSGATTHLAAEFIMKKMKGTPKLVSVGGMAASRTQVMTGQVATGWAVFPVNMDLVRKGEIRIIGQGDYNPDLNDYTMRVIAANSNWLKNNRDAATRFMKALWEGMEFNYKGGERAFERYAKQWELDIEDVKRAPEFVKIEDVTFAPIGNLDGLIQVGIDSGQLRAPLTEEQKKGLVDILYEPKVN